MKRTTARKRIALAACAVTAACAACLIGATPALAKTVKPQASASATTAAIEKYASSNKSTTVNLVSGQTYYIDRAIRLGSNTTINATGATIIQVSSNKGSISQRKDMLGGIQNVTINGGTWKNMGGGSGITVMRFSHASNVQVRNLAVYDNYRSHAVEFIACSYSSVSYCTLKAKGTKYSTSVEEQVQIDVASPATAPGVLSESGNRSLVSGQTCSNITVTGCNIRGSRGICANKTDAYLNSYHSNIYITNNKVKGISAEAVCLFNTMGAHVTGNKINTKAPTSRGCYSDGLAVRIMGSVPAASTSKIVIKNNKIKGGRYGVNIASMKGSSYKKVTIRGNRIHAANGSSCAIKFSSGAAKKQKVKDNAIV